MVHLFINRVHLFNIGPGCFDGEEAWLHLMGAEYDAVVLDVMMPKKDGYTLIQELRDKGKDIPVLFLTA
ncbi:response regulator [Anaerotignum sp.]|uniref:response regulator n=1 Tax=Anaerotignum sp. TaxID=2039241 RepID=UPI003A854E64